jgi:hypothetical protein
MDDRVTSIVARIVFILDGMEVMVSTVMTILPISASTKVTVRTLDVAQRAMVRSEANLWGSGVLRACVMITAVNLMTTASTNYM